MNSLMTVYLKLTDAASRSFGSSKIKEAALHPLHIKPDGKQMPETFPFGM
ncbi:MAG: hypothetical protein AAB347_11055 [Bacteroidota bacterium]|jgi:hypothetical protein